MTERDRELRFMDAAISHAPKPKTKNQKKALRTMRKLRAKAAKRA